MATDQDSAIVGVWEVQATDAPFPWHMMAFTPFGTMMQSNPHEGNRDDSDSSGHGIWKLADDQKTVVGKFVEIKADRQTGEYIGKGEISFSLTVDGDTFSGTSTLHRFGPDGAHNGGPFNSPVVGKRVVLDR